MSGAKKPEGLTRTEVARRVKDLGDDSWELFHYTALPRNASAKRISEALYQDARWLEDHVASIAGQVSSLAECIELNGLKR